jgi:dicarboxylate transporter 10
MRTAANIPTADFSAVTYGSTRFAIYETAKEKLSPKEAPPSLYILIPAATMSGFIGGIVGNPADIANVRMQHDKSQLVEARKNYRSVFDALARIGREEGIRGYARGIWLNCIRGAGMTGCQLASYDGFKILLTGKIGLKDGSGTQFIASVLASLVATTVCSPFDVIKTRAMSSSGGTSIMQTVREITAAEGPRWVFRGWLPSFARSAPQTVTCLFFLEQQKLIYRRFIEGTV